MVGVGAGAGAVSWLRRWVLGAGCRELAVHVVETGCLCWAPGAGAGAVSGLRVPVPEHRVPVPVPVLGAGCARGGDMAPVVVLVL